MKFYIFDITTGRLTKTLTGDLDLVFGGFNLDNEVVIQSSEDLSNHFYKNNSVKKIPEFPYISCEQDCYIFNTHTEVWECNTRFAAQVIREKRNEILKLTDYNDSYSNYLRNNKDYLIWQAYRQELRDLPEQENFPCNVVWPASPGGR